MILIVDVLRNSVCIEDSNRFHHRLKKHVFVFFAVIVGVSTSGLVHAVEMHRATSSRAVEKLKTSAAAATANTIEISSSHSSMDGGILIESLFRSGFYSATFSRICQKQTSQHLFTGSSPGSPSAELTSKDHRPHSTGGAVNSFYPSPGGAIVRVRRSSTRRGEKTRWNEILRSNECKKINLKKAKLNDSRSMVAALENIDYLDRECAEDEEHSLGCHPIPQVVHVADLCSRLNLNVDTTGMRTIIHVCPDITCCVVGHRCQVKNFAKVNKSFLVEGDKTITLSFRNHTECECALPSLKSTST